MCSKILFLLSIFFLRINTKGTLKVYSVDWCGVCNYFKFIQPKVEKFLKNNNLEIDIEYLDGES